MQATKKIVIPDEDGGFLEEISLSNFSFNFVSDIEKDGSTDKFWPQGAGEKKNKNRGALSSVERRLNNSNYGISGILETKIEKKKGLRRCFMAIT